MTDCNKSNMNISMTFLLLGIGRAIAKKLVECGVETYALSRTMADLKALKLEIASMHILHIDLQDWNKTREVVTKIGPVDLMINNAAVSRLAKFTEIKQKDIEYVMNVNFSAVFNVSQVVARTMIERGEGGSIVNISSCGAHDALFDHSTYCSSKAALDMLTKCMALELGPHEKESEPELECFKSDLIVPASLMSVGLF
ncbi:L-xylulose reductase-like [Mytilus trossulus]|uniref:L-xylulose reductase-like n=1 Tax=Mytilus trossulus TaxID=6551 RepID=UPI003007EA32